MDVAAHMYGQCSFGIYIISFVRSNIIAGDSSHSAEDFNKCAVKRKIGPIQLAQIIAARSIAIFSIWQYNFDLPF